MQLFCSTERWVSWAISECAICLQWESCDSRSVKAVGRPTPQWTGHDVSRGAISAGCRSDADAEVMSVPGRIRATHNAATAPSLIGNILSLSRCRRTDCASRQPNLNYAATGRWESALTSFAMQQCIRNVHIWRARSIYLDCSFALFLEVQIQRPAATARLAFSI